MRRLLLTAALIAAGLLGTAQLQASEKEKAVARDYSLVRFGAAPRTQDPAQAEAQVEAGLGLESDASTEEPALEMRSAR